VRKDTPAFADFNNRELIDVENPHLFVFLRTHPSLAANSVLVAANFDAKPQYLDLDTLNRRGLFRYGQIIDLASGESPAVFNNRVVVPPYHFYWLANQRPGDARRLAEVLIAEVASGATACGCPFDEGFIAGLLEMTEKMTPYAPSMRLDYLAKRPLEIEYMYRRPLREAAAKGLKLTAIETLADQLAFLDRRNRGG
jgi:hypothetical protein